MGNQTSARSAPSSQASACPVLKVSDQGGNVQLEETAEKSSSKGCPVLSSKSENVGKINEANQMPEIPNQQASTSQSARLSTERIESNIPKADGSNNTWSYPSAQMFYNALLRKGKADDVDETEMDTVVAVHNNMNENSWKDILRWEKLHCEECDSPKLKKFMGRPDELSPKAWLKHHVLGYPKPFDRHDWYVDRCGKEVRYVIDYYFDELQNKEDKVPELHDMDSVKSITIDARPALDSFEALYDRLRSSYNNKLSSTASHPSNENSQFLHDRVNAEAGKQIIELEESEDKPTATTLEKPQLFENLSVEQINQLGKQISTKCEKCFKRMNECTSEDSCSRESIALTFCMASVVCPDLAKSFEKNLDSEEALNRMTSCLQAFEKRAYEVQE